jgi:hypothetical protein
VEFPEDDEAEQTLAADIPKHAAGDEGLARGPYYCPADTVKSRLWTDARKHDAVVKVDRNYSYAIFVSHVEVYNDKVR